MQVCSISIDSANSLLQLISSSLLRYIFRFLSVFNIDVNSKVDLTDAGRAKARAQKRAEKLARGEAPKTTEGLDPYRYTWFEENDDDIDLLGGGKKTGGCG